MTYLFFMGENDMDRMKAFGERSDCIGTDDLWMPVRTVAVVVEMGD